ncbi:MAG: hypothetical protein JWN48_1641 [Myxococcaceae bacterium]|nr:hypothetical protein [Myxococcaceae bacterium]
MNQVDPRACRIIPAPAMLVLCTVLACSSDSSSGPASDAATAHASISDSAVARGSAADAAPANGAGLDSGGGTARDSGGASDASATSVTVASGSPAAQLASKLGRNHFLIGLGSDLDNDHDKDGAYTLGVPLDLHYAYLVGLAGQGGWPDWNTNGTFVNILTDSAKKHGTVPMFTLYAMAAWGEGNAEVLTDDGFMKPYWDGAKLLFERLGAFGEPAVVHFEPDWWAYAQQLAHGDPSSLPVHVTSLAPDCAGQANNLIGMGKCLVTLARKYAPKTLIGFHASTWADPDPKKIGQFLAQIGGTEADLLFVDMLDRDAGCFEAHTDPGCQRGGTTGWYLDESNQTSPNYKEHLATVVAIAAPVGKPVMWWQLPLGVPSTTPGGTAGHYRDNRVKYLFSHVGEFVAAGGVGAAFGAGASNQTDIKTDGEQFKRAVTQYYQSPTPL